MTVMHFLLVEQGFPLLPNLFTTGQLRAPFGRPCCPISDLFPCLSRTSATSSRAPSFSVASLPRFSDMTLPQHATELAPQAASLRHRRTDSARSQGEPGVIRCRYPRGPPQAAVVLGLEWRGARDSHLGSAARPRALVGAQRMLRAVGPPARVATKKTWLLSFRPSPLLTILGSVAR